MIYLGEKKEALRSYEAKASHWLNKRVRTTEREKSIISPGFKSLLNEDTVKKLITSSPDDLKLLQEDLCQKYNLRYPKSVKSFNEQAKALLVNGGYKNWFSKNSVNYDLALSLNIHTCTYCNREYTFVLKKVGGGKGMVPQFDHWFAKKDNPLLALSFYNLIPSCATCNAIKEDTKMETKLHFHPYIDKDISDSYRFNIWLEEIGKPKVSFTENPATFNKSKNTIAALNLPLIYDGHSSKELKDLYDLRIRYPKNYLDILLKKTLTSVRITDREKYRLIFGIELGNTDLHKRIMSKFKKDIIEKLINI
jgi:hypothetical protein